MKHLISRADLVRFRAAIMQRIGLQFDDARLGFLGEVLQRRLDELGRSSNSYLQGLEGHATSTEIAALARDLTVGETYFFRNKEQFDALAEVVLPARLRESLSPQPLRFLSAGCASGEEAYTMAIVLREALADPSREIIIRAVDVNPTALEKAERARYSSWSLRDTPAEVQRRWFRRDGRDMILHDAARAAVKFEAGNLASDDPKLWQPATYDAIFCRNVLMYFAPEQMAAVIERMTHSLAPGGFLFLGHAETLRGISDAFHLHHSHQTFYYELKEEIPATARRLPDDPAASIGIRRFNVARDDTWVDAIREATARVAALVPEPALVEAPDFIPAMPWDMAPALDLLRKERFAEALDYVRTGPRAVEKDRDVLLLEATLLAHDGQFLAAEDVCLRLLLIDEFNAGAHYVLALCREHTGHRERASEHDRIAAYLDPAFAMPRLHMGLLARRAGDRATAARELGQALALLHREDASRVLLFGGGFSREALTALCESALKESGGRA